MQRLFSDNPSTKKTSCSYNLFFRIISWNPISAWCIECRNHWPRNLEFDLFSLINQISAMKQTMIKIAWRQYTVILHLTYSACNKVLFMGDEGHIQIFWTVNNCNSDFPLCSLLEFLIIKIIFFSKNHAYMGTLENKFFVFFVFHSSLCWKIK